MKHNFTKRTGLKTLLLLTAMVLVFASCKKRKAFNAEDGQDLVDVTDIRSQTDLVLADANEAISNQFFLRGKSSSLEGAAAGATNCALVMDSSLIYSGKIIFNYTGSVCDNLKREGQVVVSISNYPTKKWKDKGAVLQITFFNYVVTNATDGRVMKINGSMNVTNISGGTWYELRYLNQSNLVQTISAADLAITFDKTYLVNCNLERRVTFNLQGTIINAFDEGTASQNNNNNVDCWGADRNEKTFTDLIDSPIYWSSKCTAARAKSGEVTLKVDGKYFDLKGTYGTDTDGNAITSNDCAYGWKMSWTLRNNTKHRVFSY